MIGINYIGGSLGHLVLRSICHHWPLIFSHTNHASVDCSQYANHSVQADIFLRNFSSISQQEVNFLRENQDKRILMLCHNSDLIPPDISNSIKFVNIVCDHDARIQSTFLFLCKSGKYLLDYAREKQQQKFDFYDTMSKEFCRLAAEKLRTAPGLDVDFITLDNYLTQSSILQLVQHKFDLTDPDNHEEWYISQYTRSITPLIIYNEQFAIFRSFFGSMLQDPMLYQRMLSRSILGLVDSVNFFASIHKDTAQK